MNGLYALTLILAASTIFMIAHPQKVVDDYRSATTALDPPDPIEMLETAARAGDLDAKVSLVVLREWRPGAYERAIDTLEALAAAGHAGAAHLIASAHMQGLGVPTDFETAAGWLERAVTLGSETAARELAAYRARQD